MTRIPVSFDYGGKHFNGRFIEVAGAGNSIGTMWHLMGNDNFYNGCLIVINRDKPAFKHPVKELPLHEWAFHPTPKTANLVLMTDYFAEVVTAWYQ